MSTRIDVATIELFGTPSTSGLTIVGGDSAVSTTDHSTYVDWDWPSITGSNGRGFRLHFPASTPWPNPGIVTFHSRLKAKPLGSSGLYDEAYVLSGTTDEIAGDMIYQRALPGSFKDASGNSSRYRPFMEHNGDARTDDSQAHLAFLVDASTVWGSFGGPFAETSAVYVEFTLMGGTGTYFALRLYEFWIEISDPGEDATTFAGTVEVHTSGFVGEQVSSGSGLDDRTTVGQYGGAFQVSGVDSNNSLTDASPIVPFADGPILAEDHGGGHWYLTRKDRSGAKYFTFHDGLWNYDNGIGVLQDQVKNTGIFIYDRWDDSDPTQGNVYILEIDGSGTVLRDEVLGQRYWDERNDYLDTCYLPIYGGVYGRDAIFIAGDGYGNGAGENFDYGDAITKMNLDTGVREILGSNNLNGDPLDILYQSTPAWLGPPPPSAGADWGWFLASLAVDPTDGTLWAAGEITNYLEPSWADFWDEGGVYTGQYVVVHLQQDGTVLDYWHMVGDGDARFICFSACGISVASDGTVYFCQTYEGFVRPQIYNPSHPYSSSFEYDGVWKINPGGTYPDGTYGGKLLDIVPWNDNFHMSTGTWNTGTAVWTPSGVPGPDLSGLFLGARRTFDP